MPTASTGSRLQRWLIGLAVLLILTLPLVYSAIVVPLLPSEQAAASLAMIGFAIIVSRSAKMRPLIIFLSCFASARYFYWRISSTVNSATYPDLAASVVLLLAETYGVTILFLGYFQTIEVVARRSSPPRAWPPADVFITTYNEPLEIVRRTLIGALAIDYPSKRVYVLDDGRRPEIAEMARSLGADYITRSDNRHAKAGNLNHALALTSGALIAVFDADHVPVRGFLKQTVGFFEDPGVALVQTAQHFFNPDPFERNLNLAGKVAPEQHFFYHVVQPGNDFWNSAFFCGSCALLRRSALEAIGGVKTETVTEDAHTAMELHARGYQSVYLRMPLAAGLATESFAAHVKQRMRWARGMAQILRIDCPLFKKGLTLPQRLNYFNAMAHFFFGIPRLVLILAPLSFLLFGLHPIKANALAAAAYILPHVGLSTIANSMISRRFRHSFWAAVYEISIAPYTAGVTLLAMVHPRYGRFHVTDKGVNIEQARFDLRTSWFTVLLLGLSLIGLVLALPLRLLYFSYYGADPAELDAILLNSAWALANLIILIAAASVGLEQPQQRRAPRVRREFACEIQTEDGVIACRTADMSETGARVVLPRPQAVPAECFLTFSDGEGARVRAQASRVRCDWNGAGKMEAAFDFRAVDADANRQLVELLFCRDDSWSRSGYPQDRVLRSFWHLLTTFWRATKPRRCEAALAPELRSRWRAGKWIEDLR